MPSDGVTYHISSCGKDCHVLIGHGIKDYGDSDEYDSGETIYDDSGINESYEDNLSY